ncbi:MAG: hypothetical protein ABI585_05125 [Betaproteobacteria bacterium]
MKTHKLHRTIAAMFAAAGIGFAGVALAANSPMSKDAYSAEKDRIDAAYKSEVANCKPMAGNAKDVCEVIAKGNRDMAKADAEASYKNTAKARFDARVAHADAAYNVAKEKCDDLAGNPKDVCVKEAKAAEVKSKADAKVDRVAADTTQSSMKKVSEAKQDAREDKRDAEYKVAVEKCDALSGDAKDRCLAAAKRAFGRT